MSFVEILQFMRCPLRYVVCPYVFADGFPTYRDFDACCLNMWKIFAWIVFSVSLVAIVCWFCRCLSRRRIFFQNLYCKTSWKIEIGSGRYNTFLKTKHVIQAFFQWRGCFIKMIGEDGSRIDSMWRKPIRGDRQGRRVLIRKLHMLQLSFLLSLTWECYPDLLQLI